MQELSPLRKRKQVIQKGVHPSMCRPYDQSWTLLINHADEKKNTSHASLGGVPSKT
uniref:Uncharacterized protein n=1 Tax=Arundo donax TaxID=35708 RepID=A0A0A9A9A5_ARUDO